MDIWSFTVICSHFCNYRWLTSRNCWKWWPRPNLLDKCLLDKSFDWNDIFNRLVSRHHKQAYVTCVGARTDKLLIAGNLPCFTCSWHLKRHKATSDGSFLNEQIFYLTREERVTSGSDSFCRACATSCKFCTGISSSVSSLRVFLSRSFITWLMQYEPERELISSSTSSHSAGVLVLFNRFEGSVIFHEGDTEGHWLTIAVEIHDTGYILLRIYGCNNKVANREMF